MPFLINAIAFFWFIRTIKFVLFWIYLWQLKEYHIPRFLDHFGTQKGKSLFFGWLSVIKVVLLAVLLLLDPLFLGIAWIILLMYIAEAGLFLISIVRKQVKKPVPTLKTVLLIIAASAVTIFYLYSSLAVERNAAHLVAFLLIFDLIVPGVVSIIVLLFQPLFVLARNNILKKAGKKRAEFKKLKVIGITGSYGKTSTKEFLTTILSHKFNVLGTKDHQNSEMGIAQCILQNLTSDHEIFVVEMGSYAKGGIRLLCDIAQPTMGMVTGVNEQHLALFGSLDNLLSAEGGRELRDNLPIYGTLFVNGENPYCLELYKKTEINKKIYAVSGKKVAADIWTEDAVAYRDHVSFIAMTQDKQMAPFEVKVLGKHNIQNLMGAILVAKELGMSLGEIANACCEILPQQAGISLQTGVHGINIIDSSYSSNPDGVMADLEYLGVFEGKKAVIMPCLIELGEKSANIHEKIGEKIAKVCDIAIVTTKDYFKELQKGAGDAAGKIVFCENPKEIFQLISTSCKAGDTVLLEGRVPGSLIPLLRDKQV